jgi:hypothetical protein
MSLKRYNVSTSETVEGMSVECVALLGIAR